MKKYTFKNWAENLEREPEHWKAFSVFAGMDSLQFLLPFSLLWLNYRKFSHKSLPLSKNCNGRSIKW